MVGFSFVDLWRVLGVNVGMSYKQFAKLIRDEIKELETQRDNLQKRGKRLDVIAEELEQKGAQPHSKAKP